MESQITLQHGNFRAALEDMKKLKKPFHNWKNILIPSDLEINLSKLRMDPSGSDEDADADFDTQVIIQQSLLDVYKPGIAQHTPEAARLHSFPSDDYKKIAEAIETVRKMHWQALPSTIQPLMKPMGMAGFLCIRQQCS